MQGHKDPEKEFVVTEAPTILQTSFRMILSIRSMFEFDLWTRNVKQVSIQYSFPLERTLFIKPLTKLDIMSMVNHPKVSYLKALKPIYGLPESPRYWRQTFKIHHTSEIGMK